MSQDKAFDQWHKRFRHLDRNDARIAWDAGIMDERRRAAIQPTAASEHDFASDGVCRRCCAYSSKAHLPCVATGAPADAVRDAREQQLHDAIATVCEGWTLPADARKILETALWATPKEPAK